MRSAAMHRYPQAMIDDDESHPRSVTRWIREHMAVFIGVLGLITWFVMLWLMFGDVL